MMRTTITLLLFSFLFQGFAQQEESVYDDLPLHVKEDPRTEQLFNLTANISAFTKITSVEFMKQMEDDIRAMLESWEAEQEEEAPIEQVVEEDMPEFENDSMRELYMQMLEDQAEMQRQQEELDREIREIEQEQMDEYRTMLETDYDYVCMYETSREDVEIHESDLNELFLEIVTTEGWDEVLAGFEAIELPGGLQPLTHNLSYGQIKNWVDMVMEIRRGVFDGDAKEWEPYMENIQGFFDSDAFNKFSKNLKERSESKDFEDRFEDVFKKVFPDGKDTIRNCGF